MKVSKWRNMLVQMVRNGRRLPTLVFLRLARDARVQRHGMSGVS
jgi:hypothetical protein